MLVHARSIPWPLSPAPLQVVMDTPDGKQREAWLSRDQLRGQEPLLRGFVRQLRE